MIQIKGKLARTKLKSEMLGINSCDHRRSNKQDAEYQEYVTY